jgi:hypothetical protein
MLKSIKMLEDDQELPDFNNKRNVQIMSLRK